MPDCQNLHNGYPLGGCGACPGCHAADARHDAIIARWLREDTTEHERDLILDTRAEIDYDAAIERALLED